MRAVKPGQQLVVQQGKQEAAQRAAAREPRAVPGARRPGGQGAPAVPSQREAPPGVPVP